ncbi:MAG: hypothetical protein SFV54_08825 [Bryobacteraceae bacterium]|nr:hypothetical protein [Bryobacteraceae bacterium]
MTRIEVTGDRAGLDGALEALPNVPAVFVVYTEGREPYLARTGLLRRRLLRLLGERAGPTRLLNLRGLVTAIDYALVGSSLESSLLFYELAREYFPGTYLEYIRLRFPAYVKLVLSNEFPRAHVTTRLGGGRALYFGPFRTRAGAEEFLNGTLDLFQVRRCQEDLVPSPEHPGCIYGEMNMCLRPCQQVVGVEEYSSEVMRLSEFLGTSGESLLHAAAAARDRMSAEMEFEEAARQHARYEKILAVLKKRDELAADVDDLNGVAITRSVDAEAVELRFMRAGVWAAAERFRVAAAAEEMVPLDRRLRDVAERVEAPARKDRAEHMALLARWYYSSWRDGEWLPFESVEKLPYRKLVKAISRVAARGG